MRDLFAAVFPVKLRGDARLRLLRSRPANRINHALMENKKRSRRPCAFLASSLHYRRTRDLRRANSFHALLVKSQNPIQIELEALTSCLRFKATEMTYRSFPWLFLFCGDLDIL